MPSNKELTATIKLRASKLNREVDLDGLDNTALAKLAVELQDEIKLIPKDDLINKQFFVVAGKSITTKKGIKAGGEEITTTHLTADSINDLVERGYLETK